MREARAPAACAILAGVTLGLVGCRSEDHDQRVRALPVPAPAALPDLSGAAASVREQITHRYGEAKGIFDNTAASNADRASAYGEVGVLLMAAEYRDAASTFFANAQAVAPNDARWPYYLGHLQRLNGHLTEAAALFARTRELKPDDPTTLVSLGAAEVDLGDPAKAEESLNRALALQPQSAAALYWLGRAALARKDYRTAADRLERALPLAPTRSKLQYQLSLAYRGLGDVAKAEAFARQAGVRDIEPDDLLMRQVEESLNSSMMYENRGNLALEAGRLEDAATAFRKAIELAPGDPSPRQHLGTVLFLSGDVNGAVNQFTAALHAAPRFAPAHYSLALLLDGEGQTTRAIQELTAAIENDPTYVAARIVRGDLWRRQGQLQQSLDDYRAALTLDPGSVRATLGTAMALVQAKRFVDARDLLADATNRQPRSPELAHAFVRLLAAAANDQARDPARAMALVQAHVQSDSRTVGLAVAAAMAYAAVMNWEEATAWQRRAIDGARRAGATPAAEQMTTMLDDYAKRTLPRTPWAPDEDFVGLASLATE